MNEAQLIKTIKERRGIDAVVRKAPCFQLLISSKEPVAKAVGTSKTQVRRDLGVDPKGPKVVQKGPPVRTMSPRPSSIRLTPKTKTIDLSLEAFISWLEKQPSCRRDL
jgi:hypothetical protein